MKKGLCINKFLMFVCIILSMFLIFKLYTYGTYNSIVNIFNNNEQSIINIKNEIITMEDNYIYISSATDISKCDISIDVKDDIKNLFKNRKIQLILKENNKIYFQIWSNRDYGKGVLYSTEEEFSDNTYLTEVQQLEKDGWYYYEER